VNRLAFTLKAWPVVTLLTIGLCFLTQAVAKLFGIDLPDQANIDLVRRHAGWNRAFMLLIAQVLVVMPIVEELIFRGILYKLPIRLLKKKLCGSPSALSLVVAIVSSVLFSAAHYVFQPWPDAAFVALFFFGLAQCWFVRRTDRLWCAMLDHSLFNLTNFVLLFFVK